MPTGEGDAPAPSSGPRSAPTMALPSDFEPSAPGFSAAGLVEGLAGAHGTQKIPPDLFASLAGQPQPAAPRPPPQAGPAGAPGSGLDAQALFAGLPQAPGAGPAQPSGAMGLAKSGVMGAAPMPPQQPFGAPGAALGAPLAPESGSSVKGLVIAALVTLIVAAAATFAILKLKGL